MPQSADRQEIRIRITGTDNPHQDIEDLKAWLEREPWLRHQPHDWTVRPGPADAAHVAARETRPSKGGAEELKRVLIAPGTDLLTDDEVVICRPQEPWELEQRLDAVAQEARGLLLVHFSGHGWVGSDDGDLQLMVGVSATRPATRPSPGRT
ncbi:hypothetical protein [Streptomyces halobius]|uniref:CHAT domain-containing protein n=1 Tax=Streptomyces halobius TaxID=2879846 RepID=A0ABY4MIL6_9ACTN|nr:hypothetical protein [Streptomyces halobius]UQA96166.1 hypothetical protein K9S39_33665 [Streptomyces halobius]